MVKKMSNVQRLIAVSFISLLIFTSFGLILSTQELAWSIFSGGSLSLLNLIAVSSSVSRFLGRSNSGVSIMLSLPLVLFKFLLLMTLIWLLFKHSTINVVGFSVGFSTSIVGIIFYPILWRDINQEA